MFGQRTIPDSILYVYNIYGERNKRRRGLYAVQKLARPIYDSNHCSATHTQPVNYVWNFNCPTIWLLKTEKPLVLPPVQRPSYNSYYRSTRRIQLLFKRHLTTRSIIIKQTASFFSLPPYHVFIASFVFVVVVIITIVFMVKEQYNIIIIINKPEFMRVLFTVFRRHRLRFFF